MFSQVSKVQTKINPSPDISDDFADQHKKSCLTVLDVHEIESGCMCAEWPDRHYTALGLQEKEKQDGAENPSCELSHDFSSRL